MKKLILTIAAAICSHFLHAQGVGINTLKPDPSAALDIVSDNRGLLIPRVDLKTLTDGKTINKPTHSLLIYNLNGKLPGGEGYYFNAGTKDNPEWVQVAITANVPDKVAFRAVGLLPGQLVQKNTSAKALFGAEQYDVNSSYDDSPSSQGSFFKVPVNGIYHFETLLYVAPHGAGDILLMKEKSGVTTTLFHKKNGYDLSFSIDVKLEKDEIVYVTVLNDYPGDEPISLQWGPGFSASDGYFSGRLVMKD